MKRTVLIVVLAALSFINCWGQNISGTVQDIKGIPLENATVLLLNASDSSYVAGCVTDSLGKYDLEQTQSGDFLVEVSMLGFKKQYVTVQTNLKGTKTIPPLTIEEDSRMLSNVVVIAEKKQIELEAGKTVINLSSSISGSQRNAFDALKNVPGVLAREDGSIYLYGQAGVNVLVDNKLTYLSGESLVNLLRSIPSSSVDKIELTTQPSSRYDASGNSGLINIQTKKVRVRGVNLAVYSNLQHGKYARGYESVNLSVRREKLTFYLDYSYNWGKNYLDVISDRYYPLPEDALSDELTLRMTAARRMRHASHFFRGGIGYDLSERLKFDTYVTVNRYKWRKRETTDSRFFTSASTEDSTTVTKNELNVKHTNITGGASLRYVFAEKGTWDLSFDFQRFDREDGQAQTSRFESLLQQTDKAPLTGDMEGGIDINTGQTNITYPLSEKTTLDAGAKVASISIGNEALYKNRISEEWINNTQLSNNFYYDENINAAYVKLKAGLSPLFSFEAGLRLENTNVESRLAELTGKQDSLFTDHYTNLFPNLAVQYNPAENHAFSFMYGRRIARPNYRDLNPFIEINDTYLYEQGNTELKPEFSDNFELSYFLKHQYGLSLQYSRKTDAITKSYIIKEDQLVIVTPMNLKTNHSYGMRLSLNNLKLFSWWTVHINTALTYKQYTWIFDGMESTNNRLTPMAHLSNQFNLPYGWSGEVTGFYNGWMAEGQALVHPLGQVSVGVRKNIFNNKASIQLFAEDIFATNNIHIELKGATNGWYKEKTDNRKFGFTFTWRFNSGSETKESRQNGRIEESKRINL